MEPMQKNLNRTDRRNEDDMDLGNLLQKIGGSINNFFSWIAHLLSQIGSVTLQILFFLRRNILWLLLGTAIGLGYGIYLFSKNGAKYYSDMVVRANFNSARSLYGTIDLLNALVTNNRADELAKILNITPAEAATVVGFEAAEVQSEMIVAELYKDQFLAQDRITKIRTDTFWTKTIKYTDFKTSLTKFDYPLHEISVISTNMAIFPKIQSGIIDKISENDLFQQIKTASVQDSKEEENLIASSIRGLDTLKNAYIRRISRGTGTDESSGNTLALLDGTVVLKAPELELYDKLLELRDELGKIKNRSVVQNKIVQVYSPFSSVGQKVSFFRQSIVKYSITGLGLSLIILTVIAFYKWLERLEVKYSRRAGQETSPKTSATTTG